LIDDDKARFIFKLERSYRGMGYKLNAIEKINKLGFPLYLSRPPRSLLKRLKRTKVENNVNVCNQACPVLYLNMSDSSKDQG